MTNMPPCYRHFFAFYYPNGVDRLNRRATVEVIAFTCLIARENWVELINNNARKAGKPNLSIKAKSTEVRRMLSMVKGDKFIFNPVTTESNFYLNELSNTNYFLTDVYRE